MVFRIQANLKFATTAARAAGMTTITNAVSGRNTTVITSRANDTDMDGSPRILWEGVETDTGDAGTIYALIQAMSTPVAGSQVSHHTCFHGDNTNLCLPTASKVW